MGRRRTWLVVCAALALAAAACDDGGVSVDPAPVSTSTTQPSPAEESDGVYRLGVLLPADGDGETLGAALSAGAALAIQEIADAGGVAGMPIEVVSRQEPADPAEVIDIVEEMIESERIDALVGPASSANVLAALETIVSHGVLTCTPTATATELSDFADGGYLVRTIGSDRLLADAMAGAIDSLGISRATILFPYDDYGVDVANTLRQELADRDISDVKLVQYTIDSTAEEVVDEALVDAPQAVGMIGSLDWGAPLLGELRSRVQGASVPTVVSDGLRSPELATLIDPTDRTVVDGVQGVNPASAPMGWLVELLATADPEAPRAYAGYAYDCVNLLALAAEAAESDDPARARAEIVDVSRGGLPCSRFVECQAELVRSRNIDYNGGSGSLELNDIGDVTIASYDLFEYIEGMDVNVRSGSLFARV